MSDNVADKDDATWWLYLVRTSKGSLYTGITTDVARRFAQHDSGKGGAKALRGKGPLTLVFNQKMDTRSQALRTEYAIKQLKRADKEKIISSGALPKNLIQNFEGA